MRACLESEDLPPKGDSRELVFDDGDLRVRHLHNTIRPANMILVNRPTSEGRPTEAEADRVTVQVQTDSLSVWQAPVACRADATCDRCRWTCYRRCSARLKEQSSRARPHFPMRFRIARRPAKKQRSTANDPYPAGEAASPRVNRRTRNPPLRSRRKWVHPKFRQRRRYSPQNRRGRIGRWFRPWRDR